MYDVGGRGNWKSHYIPYFKSVALILDAWNLDRKYLGMEIFLKC